MVLLTNRSGAVRGRPLLKRVQVHALRSGVPPDQGPIYFSSSHHILIRHVHWHTATAEADATHSRTDAPVRGYILHKS